MATCSIFKNFTTPVEKKSLIIILNDIASIKYKTNVEEIRRLKAEGKTEEAQEKKKQLPAFTPSATFTNRRVIESIDAYSNFIHLDFDKLTLDQMQQVFEIITQIPYTFGCFVSPSGNGLKVFVEVDTDIEHHNEAYAQVMAYYELKTGLKADPSCKDITRLCFVSYDPQLYKNITNEKFKVKLPPAAAMQVHNPNPTPILQLAATELPEPDDLEIAFLFKQQVEFTNRKTHYTDGNRNNYIYALASNCNRVGIPLADAIVLMHQAYDLAPKEIETAVRSAYTHHTAEHKKFADFANIAKSANLIAHSNTSEDDHLKTSPYFQDELLHQLPELLEKGIAVFKDRRQRDVFLTGALSILSGCLPGVKGVYDGEEVYPTLFCFIIAPAASGKGALKFAKMLGDEYHQQLLTASRAADEQYQQEAATYKQKTMSRKKGEEITDPPPTKPPFKVGFIPANASYAKIISHLEHNEGAGIICETEADTLGNIFKQEWGSYSDLLRKSFHHERISSSKKGNNEFIEVNNPRVSVALSGTPGQVAGLIASSEDGLFSRFLFYVFKVDQHWRDVSPYASTTNFTQHFQSLSKTAKELVAFLQMEDTEVVLTQTQWQILNTVCAGWLSDVCVFTAEVAASLVKRLGLIWFRICMLFTALRKFENAEQTAIMECSDTDFNAAQQIVETFLQHSLLMFNNLPRQEEQSDFKGTGNKRKFFDALPQSFTRQQAVELGDTYQIKPRSVDEILKNAVGKLLSKPKPGHYEKSTST
ncbi:MAG: DUF3987 domain-containing protein [Verrucomicrobia bacterium]|nr:DUF3987 domain-containing protein [Verrucomicrobiota bacterium]